MALVHRLIDLTFILGTGTFGTSGQDTVEVSGLRTSVKVEKAGGAAMSTADITVFGLTADVMKHLSTLGMVVQLQRRNTVIVKAGDEGGSMSTVFIGTIVNGWMDAQSAPETSFRIEAHTGSLEAVASLAPSSYPGPVAVQDVMSSLATTMGLTFENNGVTTQLPAGTYFYGSPRNQAQACAQAAGIQSIIDNGTLAIWPKGQARNGPAVTIAPPPDGGMVGYPSFASSGITIRTIYDPAIMFRGKIEVKNIKETGDEKPISQLFSGAEGTWIVYGLNYDLESMVPDGQWFATVSGFNPAFPAPLPGAA
jgi:hypothetical protein